MRMEYVVVSYPTDRDVYIDGQVAGETNVTIRVERGHHTIDLGNPLDYQPPSIEISIRDTTTIRIKRIEDFRPLGDKDINEQNIPNLIVSVESRKGGVGKTTAALCLARLLLKKGYAILVLDLDITGTNAADIAKSPFWVNDLHVIPEVDAKGTTKGSINLITLFDQHFMSGKTIPEFSTYDNAIGILRVDLNKVNVFGSQIYKTENDKNTWITSIERPGILFDDLHTLWLLEFVKQVIDNFVRVVHSYKSDKYAIILDNSPGYVGVAPAIHEWLTDRGPDCGKFLTVSSLDIQDIGACDRAIDALHCLYTSKWKTSRLFIDGGKEGDGINVDKDQESFFIRLASSTKGSTEEDDPLAFYRYSNISSSNRQDGGGEIFCNHPAKYIAGIINRVPRAVKTGRIVYENKIISDLNQGHSALGRVLSGNYENQDWRERMITYDEYIENQFLLQSLRRGRGRNERRLQRLIDVLTMAEKELHNDTNNNKYQIKFYEIDNSHQEQLVTQLVRANDIVHRARSAVEDAGLDHLARLIHDEWFPGSIVLDFRRMLTRLLRESDLPYFEINPFEFDNNNLINSTKYEFVVNLMKQFRMELRHSNLMKMEIYDIQTADVLSGVLSWLVGLSLSSPLLHKPMMKDLSELFAGILAIELRHWSKRSVDKFKRFSIQRFLAQEKISQNEDLKNIDMPKTLQFFRHFPKEEENSIADFYSACTSAQARLIDFNADSRFLLQLLRFIVKDQMNKKGDLFPYVKDIAENVIVNKTLSHEDAPAQMAKALQSAEYFREFDGVLNNILKVWGLD